MNRFQERYQQKVMPQLKKEFEGLNIHQLPKIEKIVVNVGLGRASSDKKAVDTATNTLRKITGQQPQATTAKASIAGFKLRQGQKIGLKVTLRRDRMYDFWDKLISIVIPRMRDFHGLSRQAFDKDGNYSIGFSDQTVFPDLSYEDTAYTHGLQITVVTSTKDKDHVVRMLELMGLPLERAEV